MSENKESNHPGKSALQAGAEVVKYLTALGTGAIVFSAGLLNDKIFLSTWAKWFIFFSWVALAVSVVAGLLAGMRIPMQLAAQNYNLQDKLFEYPVKAQQLGFILGIFFLGVGLTIILTDHKPATNSNPEPTPTASPQASTSVTSPSSTVSPSATPTPTITPSPTATQTPLPPTISDIFPYKSYDTFKEADARRLKHNCLATLQG